jgi:LPS-assembly protein
MPPPPRAVSWLCLAAAAGLCQAAPAEEDACPEPPPRPPLAAAANRAPAETPTDIRARTLSSAQGGVSEFSGNVELRRDGQYLSADRLRYDQATDQTDASGRVSLQDATGTTFQTEETHLNLGTHVGYTGPGTYRLQGGRARGDAQRIDFEGPDRTRLTRARFTTCAPGQDDWFLRISELKLDTQKQVGTAYHGSVNFLGVPVFYLPYLSFPLSDQRKSGFLLPRLGTASNRGLELAAPYYFNLAPNYDDTVTPHLMTRRGLQIQNEFRYLTPGSQGTLELEALPNDKLANGDDRAAGTYRHRQTFSPLWSGNVDVHAVSDKQYLNDFGDDIGITSQTHLPQNAGVDYRGASWSFSARAADYQTIDPTILPADRPYRRLPQLNLSFNPPADPNRVNYLFDSEAVNFRRDVGVTGERLSLYPALSLPLSNAYGFITPKLGVRHIAYHLSDAPDRTPSLTRGVFSLDSGLYFERDSHWSGKPYTQTLEPRLYYLYIPRKAQDDLPNFDTSVPDMSFSNLFRDNRFIGGDRIGDSNQLTAAVTTRFLDAEDGAERARASLGRIYYFQDRQVNLPAGPDAAVASDIVGEAVMKLASHWYARANAAWDRADNHLQQYGMFLQYNPARNRIVNVGKQFSRGTVEQTDVSAEWPIAGRWSFRTRSIYSWLDHRNVDSYAGVEYNACCWALRILGRRYLSVDTLHDNAATQNNSIMFELELTGLSKLGHIPDSPLRQSVFSFPSPAPAATPPAAPES